MYGSRRSSVAGFGVERSMWQRQTQWRGLLRDQRVQRRRLRVVDERDVPAADELARVHLVVAPPRVPLLVGQVLGRALQRVVHHLGRVEELLAPVDHLPLDVEPDVDHQRHERVEDLRDAAAERGRRDVQDALALQRLGELADLVDQGAADDVRVVGEALVADGDGLEHGAAIYLIRWAADPVAGRVPSVTGTVRCLPLRTIASDDAIAWPVAGQIARATCDALARPAIAPTRDDHVAAGVKRDPLEHRARAGPGRAARPSPPAHRAGHRRS